MSAATFKVTRATPQSRIAAVLGSIVVVGLAAGPLWLDRNVVSIAGQMLVYVGLASLWNLLAGYGGLGNLWGTLIGGIILGVAQSLGAMIDPGWQLLAGHLAFLLVLAVRPLGLMPRVEG